MKILIACEFSGIVRMRFLQRPLRSFLRSASDERPVIIFKVIVLEILDDGWDLMVAHPPCTHLAVSGARWFKDKRDDQEAALGFVRHLLNAPI